MLKDKTKQELTSLVSKIFNIPLNDAMKLRKAEALEILEMVQKEEVIEEIEIKGEYVKVTETPKVLKRLLDKQIERETVEKLTDDTLVEVMNFTPGKYTFRTPKIPETMFELHEFGDTHKLPLRVLRKTLMFHPKILKEFNLVILNPAAVKALNLEREYEKLKLDTFDLYKILELDHRTELPRTLANLPAQVRKNIGLRVQQLASTRQITDLNVLNAVQEATGVIIIKDKMLG